MADAEVAAQHVCRVCDTPFSRLDHLKRHMSSLHDTNSPKLHGCKYCGKSFARRDVLTRHYLSCAATKPDGSCNEPPAKRTRPSEQDQPTDRAARASKGANSPASDTIRVSGTHKELTSAHTSGGLPSPPESHASHHRTEHPTEEETSAPIPQDNHPVRQGIAPVGHNDGSTSAQHGTGADRDDAARAGPKVRTSASKRGRYVSNACLSCQRRKVKCSGERICMQCRGGDQDCVYTDDRRRRTGASTRAPPRAALSAPGSQAAIPDAGGDQQALISTLMRLTDRIATLERGHRLHQGNAATDVYQEDGESDEESGESTVAEAYAIAVPSVAQEEVAHAQTSLLQAITAVDRRCANSLPASTAQFDDEQAEPGGATTWDDVPRMRGSDLKRLASETRSLDAADTEECVSLYLTLVNPQRPCLNDSSFRANFASFVASNGNAVDDAEGYQFAAQLNLIIAIVQILTSEDSDSGRVPGWQAFCRADEILHHLVWLGNGNIMTLQCLTMKAMYLLFIEKADSAYDTMGRAIRLCFQLGLHNQPAWRNLAELDVVMRQRIFWTLLSLERSIALHCGAPYLIRELDYHVDFPRAQYDTSIYPDQPLPDEMLESSYCSYVVGAAKWSRLSGEIWDKIFAVKATERRSLELIASMDARILYTMTTMAPHLQWPESDTMLNDCRDVPFPVPRQRLLLYLEMNHLRLLLRHECMVAVEYDEALASECLTIASSSVDAVQKHLDSCTFHAVDRFPSAVHLVRALLSLACVVTGHNDAEQTQRDAINAYIRGLGLLTKMAPTFSNARHALRRMANVTRRVRSASTHFQTDQAVGESVASQLCDMQFGGAEVEVLPNQHFAMFPQQMVDLSWPSGDGCMIDGSMAAGDCGTNADMFRFDGTFALEP